MDVPDHIARLVVAQEYDPVKLPRNRRRRRTLERAERIHVHLFSGEEKKWLDMEQDGTVIICLDKVNNPGQDLLNDDVYGYILSLAKSGKMVSVIGGPPCRTVSACRSRSPGPRPVRSEEHPYAFPNLTNSEKEMVEGDSILWLRMMTVYIVAQETAKRKSSPTVRYAQEQPRDPGDYRVDVPRENLVSLWRFRAWKAFALRYKMEMIHLDQGPLGHERRKPTTIATNLERLRELGEVAGSGQGGEAWSENLGKRIAQTKRWSAWAPGLVQAFKEALRSHEEGRQEEIRALRPLSAAAMEQWKGHFACDHQPARRDCRTCVESQGRGRPHRRIQHPQAYTLSVDLSGRLAAGKDQRCAKYFVAAVYTYPTDREGKSLLGRTWRSTLLEEKEEGERLPEKDAEKEIKAKDIWGKMVEAQDSGHQPDVCGADHLAKGVGCPAGDCAHLCEASGNGLAGLQVAHGSGQGADGSTGEALGGGQEHREGNGSRRCFQGEWPGISGDWGPQAGDQDVAQGRRRTSNLVAYGVQTCWGTTSPKATTRGRTAGEGDAALGNDRLPEEELERKVSGLEVQPRAGQDHGSGCSYVSYIGRVLGAKLWRRTVLCDYGCNQGARGGDRRPGEEVYWKKEPDQIC